MRDDKIIRVVEERRPLHDIRLDALRVNGPWNAHRVNGPKIIPRVVPRKCISKLVLERESSLSVHKGDIWLMLA